MEFFENLHLQSGEGIEPVLIIFPPSLSLPAALRARPADLEIALGVQNIHWEDSGAFTGEISAAMAVDAGATHVLVGHSERRHLFGETDDEVARKVGAAFTAGLIPVVCVGETLSERKSGHLREVILRQLDAVLPVLREEEPKPFYLAYEPVWAIGTGETATPQDASEAHGLLRERLEGALGPDRGGETPILYGGSVKPGNASDLLGAPDVDGVLVGGASLDPASFSAIAAAGTRGSR
jgi:triosephosphate isomerase